MWTPLPRPTKYSGPHFYNRLKVRNVPNVGSKFLKGGGILKSSGGTKNVLVSVGCGSLQAPSIEKKALPKLSRGKLNLFKVHCMLL